MQFKNMKIEINDQQPIDEVVRELERLGFKKWCLEYLDRGLVVTNKKGLLTTFRSDVFNGINPITLAELKEMQ